MKKLHLLLLAFLISVLIIGCSGDNTNPQTDIVGKFILNQDRIETVNVVKGQRNEIEVFLNNSEISALIKKVEEIPVQLLTKDQEDNFMPERIVEETSLTVYLYEDSLESMKSLNGLFLIWPDGYLYIVDVSSMQGDERTQSYLSESKYPELYEWLNEKI